MCRILIDGNLDFFLICLSAEAVFARCLSSLQGERIEASKQIPGPSKTKYEGDKKQFVNDIKYVSG